MTLPDKTDSETKHFFDDNKKSILEMAGRPVALLTIAQAHGIPPSTLSNRVLDGDDEFAIAFQKCRASLQANLATNVMDRGDGDWRMHAHVLERLFPSGYAKERPNTIKVEASAFDWNLLGRIQEKDLAKRETKLVEAEAVEVNND